jgi:hypothetical protein
VLTASGLWRVENQTRYDTADIVALFNAVEEYIQSVSSEPLASRCDAKQGVVRFRDYSPANRVVEINHWIDGVRQRVTQVCYLRRDNGRCRSDRVVGLIVPSKLYGSALEALCGGGAETSEDTAPEAFSRALVLDLIRHLYHSADWQGLSSAKLPSVKIMKKRATKKQTLAVRGDLLNKAGVEVGDAFGRVYEALSTLRSVEARYQALPEVLTPVGMKPSFTLEDVQKAVALTSEILAALSTDSDTIRSAQQ